MFGDFHEPCVELRTGQSTFTEFRPILTCFEICHLVSRFSTVPVFNPIPIKTIPVFNPTPNHHEPENLHSQDQQHQTHRAQRDLSDPLHHHDAGAEIRKPVRRYFPDFEHHHHFSPGSFNARHSGDLH